MQHLNQCWENRNIADILSAAPAGAHSVSNLHVPKADALG